MSAPIQTAVVVGAGTMGHGIAQVLAQAGISPTLVDLNPDVVKIGHAKIVENLDKGVQKGKLSDADRDATLARLRTATTTAPLSEADLLVEAIPERLELKARLFAEADAVIGLHFFNPVHIMKLLEIVRGPLTSEATLQAARDLAQRLNKTAIVVNDAPGFATSRLGICLGNEAMRMLEEGVASAADIDAAMKLGYGHPMGPLALSDLVGLDVRLNISEGLFAELGTDGFRAPRLLKRLVTLGHVGKKAGRGFYLWDNGEIVGENPAARRQPV